MSFKHFNKIVLALFLVVFAINISLAGDFKIMSHSSVISSTPDWAPEDHTLNITFTVANSAASVDNITNVEMYNTKETAIDPFNITNVYCPAGFTSKKTEGESTGNEDNITDKAECVNGNIQIGASANITLTVVTKDLTDGTTFTDPWTVVTKEGGAAPNVRTDWPTIGIDAKGPAITFISPVSPIGNGVFTFNVSLNESEVKVDNSSDSLSHVTTSGSVCGALSSQNLVCIAAQNLCYYSFDMDAGSGDGQCNVTVKFNDTFNNTGSQTAVYQIDNTGPVIVLISHINGSEIRSGDIVQFNITDSPAGLDFANWSWGLFNTTSDPIYSVDTSGMSEGDLTISVWANDSLGNVATDILIGGTNDTLDNITIIIDNTKPDVVINAPAPGYFGAGVFVNATVTDENTVASAVAIIGSVSETLSLTGGFWTGTVDVTSLIEGNYTLTINASDMAGNYNDTETVANIGLDHTKPVVDIVSPLENENKTEGSSRFINATISESGSGIAADADCTIREGSSFAGYIAYNSSTGRCEGDLIMGTSVGTKNITVLIEDIAGNEGKDSVQVIFSKGPSSSGSGGGGYKVLINSSSNVTDTNNRPEVTAPHVDKETPKQGEILTCIAGTYSDEDGDVKSGDQWKWMVDGKEVYYGLKNTYDTSSASAGAKITCSNRATDGIDYSIWADSTNSAIVQASEEVKEMAAAAEEETEKPANPFTGAFIGSLLGDNIFLAILAVVVMGGSIAVLTVRYLKRRGLKFKVQ